MRKFLRHCLFVVVSTLFLLFLGLEAAAALTKPDIQRLPALKDGDLVFQTTVDVQSLATMMASNTLFTHVGMIKTRRNGPPVVVEVGPVRETPLHAGHLQTMLNVTNMGAAVMPPVPAFYAQPKSLEDMVRQTVGRALDLFGLNTDIERWGEPPSGA